MAGWGVVLGSLSSPTCDFLFQGFNASHGAAQLRHTL